MDVRTLFLTGYLAVVPLLCSAAEESLIYDEDYQMDAELRVASPCGEWEIVYTGYQHREAPILQRVTTISLVHRDGRQFLLEESHGKSTAQVVLSPWSPDGKWLAVQAGPRGTAGFRFYRVNSLPQALMNEGLCFEVHYRSTPLFCEQGTWAADGSFRFLAGFSGDYAPYRADIAEEKVEVQRIGEFQKRYPSPTLKIK